MNRAEFLAERRTGLGASDLSAALGENPYMSEVELWMKKTGRIEDDFDSMRLRFGMHNEEFIAKEYERVTGHKVQRFNPMLRSAAFPNIVGHVDRLVIPAGQKVAAHKGEIRTNRGMEAKTVDSNVFRFSGAWGEPGTDQVPTYYLIQVVGYMGLTGCARWDLAALVGSGAGDLLIYNFARDLELEVEIFARSQEWWNRHVVKDIPPEPRSQDDVDLLYPQAKPKEIVLASPEAVECVAKLSATKEKVKALEEEADNLSLEIKRFMRHADTLVGCEGNKLVTWNNRKGRMVFDLDGFVGHLCPGAMPAERALFIEDAKRTFYTRGEPGRTFLLK